MEPKLEVYYVDGRDLLEVPAHNGYDVAVCYQPAVEDAVKYWREQYEALVKAIKGNCHDNFIEEKEKV